MLKRILLILVGGTICTRKNEYGTLSISSEAGVMLKENYLNSDSVYADDVCIESTRDMYILSENMTVDRWNSIIALYTESVKDGGYDGVVFAHGTDSLAYSASLFSMLLADTKIPVFFVSSNERLESSRSNGDANFRYAVECICRGIEPNVYVTYKNLSDGRMYLHLGSRLRQCGNYSEDFFSVGAIDITDISDENCGECFAEITRDFPSEKRSPLVESSAIPELSDNILMLNPYVGLRYDAIDYTKFAAVLHGTYHSGTVCSEKAEDYGRNSVLSLLDACADCGDAAPDIYISPSKLCGEVYDSLPVVGLHRRDEVGVSFLYGMTQEAAYAKLVIAYSMYDDKCEIRNFMETQINFEKIYE